MPLTAKQQKLINEFKALGIDTTAMEEKINSSSQAANYFENNILDRAEFNTYQTEAKQREELLLNTARELIAAKALSESKNEQLATISIARVAELEGVLQETFNLTDEQIENIDNDSIKALAAKLQTNSNSDNNINKNNNNGNNNMTKEEIDAEIKANMGNMAGASVLINSKITQQAFRFRALNNRDMTEKELDEFTIKAWQNLNNNIDVATTANQMFKLDELQTTKNTEAQAARDKQIADNAVAEFRKNNPELSMRTDSRFKKDTRGSVLGLDLTRRGSSNINPSNSTDNNNNNNDNSNSNNTNINNEGENGSRTNVSEKVIEAGANNQGGYIRTQGFKDGELPYQIRESRGREGRVGETMAHIDEENINIYQDM